MTRQFCNWCGNPIIVQTNNLRDRHYNFNSETKKENGKISILGTVCKTCKPEYTRWYKTRILGLNV